MDRMASCEVKVRKYSMKVKKIRFSNEDRSKSKEIITKNNNKIQSNKEPTIPEDSLNDLKKTLIRRNTFGPNRRGTIIRRPTLLSNDLQKAIKTLEKTEETFEITKEQKEKYKKFLKEQSILQRSKKRCKIQNELFRSFNSLISYNNI